MKKIITILIIIVALIIVAFFSWYFFVRDQSVPLSEIISSDTSPFGSGDNVQPTADNRQPTTNTRVEGDGGFIPTDGLGAPTTNLFRLSSTPAAGFIILNNSSSSPFVRYVDRATGHIYDVDLLTGEREKITNLTIPKVYEAYFRLDGRAVLMRTLKEDRDEVENLSLFLTPPEVSGELYTATTTMLRGNIGSFAVGGNDTLYYNVRDTQTIVSSSFNNRNTKTLYVSPYTNWSLANGNNRLVVYTKPSALVPGYSYALSGGVLTKIFGPARSLVALPSNADNRVLFSSADGGTTRLFVYNPSKNSSYELSPASLADKCVWGVKSASLIVCGAPSVEIGANEPDSWYMGATHFSDFIWFFDTTQETAKLLLEPPTMGVDVDVSLPQLSPNEDYLVFINKLDLSLWAFKLELF